MAPPLRRYFEGLFLLLVATGFATLASTARLGWPVVMAASTAYLLRAWWFWRGRQPRLPPRWLPTGWLLYLPVFFLDGLFLSHGFVPATLHLVVLAGAVQTYALRTERDYLTLGLLALLEVLAAALLTVSGAFLALFVLFLVLLIATLVAHEMMQSQAASGGFAPVPNPSGPAALGHKLARLPAPSQSPRRGWLGSLLRFSLLLSLGVVSAGAAIFFLLPRTAAGSWASRPLTALSGFSDQVELGDIAQLQRNNQPVMHIRITQADASVTPEMFQQIPWRGRGLTYFDGRTWSSPDSAVIFSTNAGRLEVNRPAWNMAPEIVHYQVTLEPIGSPVLFFPPRLLRASTHMPVLAWERATATLSSLGAGFAGISYAGISDLAQPTPSQLRQAPAIDSALVKAALRADLQLPSGMDPRVRALAHAVVAHVPADNWDRMQALSDYLQNHYQYTLQNLPQGSDPLSAFLFDQPAGDCEYFASALAVMARTLGIPTRVVNGFVLGSYNPISGEYLVRGSDAHTWVEAYFPPGQPMQRGSWISFDATPAATGPEAGLWPQAGMMLDAISSFWQEWIVNYDWIQQASLARLLQQDLHGAAAGIWQSGRSSSLRHWPHPAPEHLPSWAVGGLLALLTSLAWGVHLRLRGRGWRWGGRPSADEVAIRQAQRAYRRFQRYLHRAGVPHRVAETAPELLAAVNACHPNTMLANAALDFVAAYHAARFGPPDAAPLLSLRAALVRVRQACRNASAHRRRSGARATLSQ